jgi:hypothetical protein
MAGKFQEFFGDDAIDSLKSAPGALGGLLLGSLRQIRLTDFVAFALVLAGWAWIAGDLLGLVSLGRWEVLLALMPTLLWLTAGIAGVLIFEISGLGVRVLAFWEAYVLILVFALLGSVTLRIALGRDARRIHRGPPAAPPPTPV